MPLCGGGGGFHALGRVNPPFPPPLCPMCAFVHSSPSFDSSLTKNLNNNNNNNNNKPSPRPRLLAVKNAL